MTVKEAKEEYNKLLKRHYDAVDYFDSNVPQEEKERFLPNYQEVLKGLNYYLGRIGVYKDSEVLEGFNERVDVKC